MAPARSIRSARRRFAIAVATTAMLATACGSTATTNESSTDLAVDRELTAATTVPATPAVTTAPLAMPTVGPTPTAVAFPTPTPPFGPTGRPSYATATSVLTATDSIVRPLVYDGPDGDIIPVTYTYLNGQVDPQYDWFVNPTFFGNDLALLVVEGEPGDSWAKVKIPTRPALIGWVQTDDWKWSESNYYVRVNLGNNTVTVWNGDEVIADTSVVTGDSGRETPVVSTYIDEIMPGPSSSYGPWLMSLGVFSDAINTFGSQGGLPKVAMHGTNRPDLLGQYASNGCIRLPNDIISALAAEVPVGTRVDIVNEA